MQRSGRFFSRISFRLLAFNLLLVFLPVAGVLFLGAVRGAAGIGGSATPSPRRRIAPRRGRGLGSRRVRSDRARAADRRPRCASSTRRATSSPTPIASCRRRPPRSRPDRSVTTRSIASARFSCGRCAKFLQPPQPPLDVDFYETATQLTGPKCATRCAVAKASTRRSPPAGSAR